MVKVDKDTILRCIEYINLDQEFFFKQFKKEFPDNTLGEVWDAAKASLLSDELKSKLLQIVPICYEINGKIFLKGETSKPKFDLIGDDLDYQSLIELYDMTEEMRSGNSYTFYVSTTEYFKIASVKDTVAVIKFLDSI